MYIYVYTYIYVFIFLLIDLLYKKTIHLIFQNFNQPSEVHHPLAHLEILKSQRCSHFL